MANADLCEGVPLNSKSLKYDIEDCTPTFGVEPLVFAAI